MKLGIINGPNLNLLGKREQSIYGNQSFNHYFSTLEEKYLNIEFQYFQSNHEGEIIDKIQDWGYKFDGIIINAGGYTHTSVAIGDAIKAVSSPFIEVHISNIYARESFRHKSYLSPVCQGGVFGLGIKGYDLAVQHFL